MVILLFYMSQSSLTSNLKEEILLLQSNKVSLAMIDGQSINVPSKICGRLLKQTISLQIFSRLSSTNFTWSILEYFVPNIAKKRKTKQLL